MNDEAVLVIDALEAVFVRESNYHRAARALRNRLIIMSLIALASAVALVAIQWWIGGAVFVTKPTGLTGVDNWQLLLLVMVFGAIGALLTSIKPISTMPPSNSPFNFPLQQALLKIMVGTLTATVGIVALATVTNAKGFDSLPAMLGTAAAFGAGQQAVTRMLDDRANALISQSPSTPTETN